MSRFLKKCVQKIPGYHSVRTRLHRSRQRREVAQWEASGRPSPPPHFIKQQVLKEHSTRYGLKTLIETGTFKGDMVEAMKKDFDTVYSIELSPELYQQATRRFQNDANVEIVQGDSGREIKTLVKKMDAPALFWLDGHYSAGVTAKGEKETPVCEELNHILEGSDFEHIILIDDARLFGTDPAYPSLEEIKQQVAQFRPEWSVMVATDSIRITPQ